MADRPVTVMSPEPYCYIIDLETGDKCEFQLMPDVFGESKSANWDQIPIIGRSLPYLGYAHSGPRTASFTLLFHAIGGKWTPVWVMEHVRFLKSLVYPDYQNGFTFPPHRAMLIVGEAIGMVCVAANVTTNWMGPWTFSDSGEAYPFRAEVTIDLIEWGANGDEFGHPHGVFDARTEGMSNSLNNSLGMMRAGGGGPVSLPTAV